MIRTWYWQRNRLWVFLYRAHAFFRCEYFHIRLENGWMKEDCVTVQTRLSVPRRVKFISSYRLSWKTSCLNSNLYFISTLIMYIIMCCKTNNSPLCNIIITQRITHPKMCPSKYHHYGQHLNTAQFRSTKCIQRWLAFKFSAVTKHSLLDKSINIPCVSYLFFFFWEFWFGATVHLP